MQNIVMKRTQIRITQLQHDKIKDLQNKTGITLSEHIRRAIDDYFETLHRKEVYSSTRLIRDL